ncbi:hypothetical protein QLS71_003455 [Mariniflexile litorale]|uniref:Uncharacterized protein n=1 Tax=Mariniflexile litorale TaxID=3045158 RepID=A0AAU7EIA4_9FLAO|nr:hypothetical protein [Mariniflexile sp. KMM 9835]MDQ8210074.1 hypothetical protein [Mariniflexile sp. KMM 9835]
MKKKLTLIMMVLCHYYTFSQVGIGTTTPSSCSILDIESTNQGVLLPRLTTIQRNGISSPSKGLLIFNVNANKFEYNSGIPSTPIWSSLSSTPLVSTDSGNILSTGTDSGVYLSTTTYMGKLIITGTGNQIVSGLPFKPSQIKFTAHANIETYNLNADNGVGNNNNTLQNTFGTMSGFATNYSNVINQQVIFIGGSGNSINNISRYASDNNCIGIRYCNQNGTSLGLTVASLSSFDTNGFTINVVNHTENIVVVYEAFR